MAVAVAEVALDGPVEPVRARSYRILVTGSRTWLTYPGVPKGLPRDMLYDLLNQEALIAVTVGSTEIVVIEGGADGADQAAREWTEDARQLFGCPIPIRSHTCRPNYLRYPSHVAPFKRNEQMVKEGAEVCISAINPCAKPTCPQRGQHDSHGSAHCLGLALAADIPCREPLRLPMINGSAVRSYRTGLIGG